jgi:hypothetical protein
MSQPLVQRGRRQVGNSGALRDLRDRPHKAIHVAADERHGPVAGDQLFRGSDRSLRLPLVVPGEEGDRPTRDPASRVSLLDGEKDSLVNGCALDCQHPSPRVDLADHDRLIRRHARRPQDQKNQSGPHAHWSHDRFPPQG